jgi:hypothetical protein
MGIPIAATGKLKDFTFPFIKLLGLLRTKYPWGTVYDSITKNKVSLAVVRLFAFDNKSNQKGKLLETQVTDQYGRYLFLPKKGYYYLEIEKPGYRYPSHIIQRGITIDGKYNRIYHGSDFKITSLNNVINYSIPIDPALKGEKTNTDILTEILWKIRYNLQYFSLLIWAVVIILNFLILLIMPNLVNFFIAGLYIVFVFFHVMFFKEEQQSWGIVYDSRTKEPIPLAVVQLINIETKRIVKSRLTDYQGRFSFIPFKGRYILTVKKQNYLFPSRKKKERDDYYGSKFRVKYKNQYIGMNIPIDPVYD